MVLTQESSGMHSGACNEPDMVYPHLWLFRVLIAAFDNEGLS